jgi:hypothetical protein
VDSRCGKKIEIDRFFKMLFEEAVSEMKWFLRLKRHIYSHFSDVMFAIVQTRLNETLNILLIAIHRSS